MHLRVANARLQWQLVAWLNSGTGGDETELKLDDLMQLTDDPVRRQQVQTAFTKAAESLGLASRDAVVQLAEELAQELAYIEALRERLLRRAMAMMDKLNRMAHMYPRRWFSSGDADPGPATDRCGAEADRPQV